jgi:hypothetical protein
MLVTVMEGQLVKGGRLNKSNLRLVTLCILIIFLTTCNKLRVELLEFFRC